MRCLFALMLLGCGARTGLGVHGGGGVADASTAPTGCRVTAPTVLFAGQPGAPRALAIDDASVYWSGADRVEAVDKSGANHRVLASERKYPTGIAVAGGFVYWGEYLTNLIVRAPTSGQGAVDTLCSSLSGSPWAVTLLGSDVYWCSYTAGTVDRLVGTASTAEIVDVGGGMDTSIVTDGRFVFYAARPSPSPAGTVDRYDPATQTITKLADTFAGLPSSLATDGVNVYFNEAFAQSGTATIIGGVGVQGGPTSVLAQIAVDANSAMCTPTGCQGAVATDGQFVYFTSAESDGVVRKVAVSGGSSSIVADHQAQPEGVAVDDACVYWADYVSGNIMAAPK